MYGVEKIIAVLDEMPGDFRIRLSSLEPAVVNADYVKRLLKYLMISPSGLLLTLPRAYGMTQ